MNRTTKLLLMLTGVLLFLMSSCSDNQSSKVNAVDSSVDPVRLGEEVFRQQCRICHGAEGKGDIGPDLTDNEWKYGNSDDQLIETISKGRPGGMPGWGNKLSQIKIENVVSYVKSLSGK